MKKLLILFALCALASSSFAEVTTSDWKVHNEFGFGFGIPNASPGFEFDGTKVAANTLYIAEFNGNISGWLYDSNETFSVVITGFDNAGFVNEKPNELYVRLRSGQSKLCYKADYSGAGTYVFGPDDVDMISGTVNTGDSFSSVAVSFELDGNVCYINNTTTGSVRFAEAVEEKPDTVVPEPTTAAYAIAGLLPLIGIKRKIKK